MRHAANVQAVLVSCLFLAEIGSDGNDDGDGNEIDRQICLGITGDSLVACM